MVEVEIFLEPLVSNVSIPVLAKSLINWVEVLHSALDGDEGVSSVKDRHVGIRNAERVPPLLHLWVRVLSDLKISVESLQ